MGSVLIMGRRTLDSIGRVLPGRPNVVVTRDPVGVTRRFPGVEAASDWPTALNRATALARACGCSVISVIGGGAIYRLALPVADALLLTFVPEEGGGDTFFPEWEPSQFREVERESFAGLERVTFERLGRSPVPRRDG
jgi:dihydrofolate reductase